MSANVYVIQHAMGPVKIGLSENIPERFKAIQSACPYTLSLVGIIETDDPHQVEAKLHQRYGDLRRHGEWFDLGPNSMQRLLDLCDADGVDAARAAMEPRERQRVMQIEAALR